jgi:hypothetical protein
LGDCLHTLGSLLQTTKVAEIILILFFHGTSYLCIKFDKKWAGLHAGRFSGHAARGRRKALENRRGQGCQIFLVQHSKMGKNIPNDHKIYQMAVKYFQWP